MRRDVLTVLAAKTARTFCYGFLGILVPVHLSEQGMSAAGIGIAVTLMLVGSAGLTWAVRWPAERFGVRVALLALAALTGASALLFLSASAVWLVVVAAVLGNIAVSTTESGPFQALEQVIVARAVRPARRTLALSVYNLLGYVAAALGAALVTVIPAPRVLFAVFLAASVVQAAAYALLPRTGTVATRRAGPLPSAPLIRRLAALFALDAFAGGFVVQSLVAYYLHTRFGLALETLGPVFFAVQIVTAVSLLLAVRAATTFGLLATMVVSHLVSNLVLIAIAVAPTAGVAIGLLLVRHLLSQMDVPTRQAYLMAIVEDAEREAAATLTNLARTVAQAITPAVTGWVMQSLALSAPFVLGGGLKIVYDVLVWRTFKDVPLREEAPVAPVSLR